ncbi:MAG: hypothetical protein K6E49_03900 [Lachnospiraceae bacterium]|nr:hypothetical protein [Lachnospiraceae bacterium]
MKEYSTERKSIIAQRKKQFLTLVLCFLFAVLPTVKVMAETIVISGDNTHDNIANSIGKSVYPDSDKIILDNSGDDYTFGSGRLLLRYSYNGNTAEDQTAEFFYLIAPVRNMNISLWM